MELVKLEPHERPTHWFVTSVEHRGRVTFRLLSHQFVPAGPGKSEGEYLPGDTTWPVNADKNKRSEFPLGSIFAVDDIQPDMSYYRALNATVMCLTSPDASCTQDARDAYAKYERRVAALEEDEKEKAKPRSERRPAKASLMHRMRANTKSKPPSIEEDGYYLDPDLWYLLCRNIAKCVHTLLVGPTGGGKTVLTRLLADRADKRYSIYNMGAMQDPVAGLLGTNSIVTRDGKTVTEFKPAIFAREISQAKTLFVWDELSRMPWGSSNILFPVIDTEQRYLPMYYAQSEGSDTLPFGRASVVVATANLGAEYINTVNVDRALLDRFMLVEIPYLPAEQETKMLKKLYDIRDTEAGYIVNIANVIRNGYKAGELSSGISPRYTKEVAALVRDGFDPIFAIRQVFLPLFEGTDTMGDRSTVLTAITSK